jgi:hypothetical protein
MSLFLRVFSVIMLGLSISCSSYASLTNGQTRENKNFLMIPGLRNVLVEPQITIGSVDLGFALGLGGGIGLAGGVVLSEPVALELRLD